MEIFLLLKKRILVNPRGVADGAVALVALVRSASLRRALVAQLDRAYTVGARRDTDTENGRLCGESVGQCTIGPERNDGRSRSERLTNASLA